MNVAASSSDSREDDIVLNSSFTWLALQGFGGVLTVAQRELVERRGWYTHEGFLEDWALAQVLPGPNVCNLALMFGDKAPLVEQELSGTPVDGGAPAPARKPTDDLDEDDFEPL